MCMTRFDFYTNYILFENIDFNDLKYCIYSDGE